MDHQVSRAAWANLLVDIIAGGRPFHRAANSHAHDRSGHGYNPEESYHLTEVGMKYMCSHLPARFTRFKN